jgi:hypothetical protein
VSDPVQPTTPTPPPAPVTPPAPAHDASAEILRRLDRIEQESRLNSLQGELGVNATQAAAVRDLMSKHQLPAQQAHLLAQNANPDLFKQPNPGDFQPGHMSARPAGGMPIPAPEKKDPEEEYWKKIETLSSRRQADALNNRLGHLAAEAAGMADSHKLLEI